jgi:hypothetical protein
MSAVAVLLIAVGIADACRLSTDVSSQTRIDRSPPEHRIAAMAVSHWIEHQIGWSIKKFVRTARRYPTVTIQAGRQTLTAADPLPDDLARSARHTRQRRCALA